MRFGSTTIRITALRAPRICTLATPLIPSRSSLISSPRRINCNSSKGAETVKRIMGNMAPSTSVTTGSFFKSSGKRARATASCISFDKRERLLASGSTSMLIRPEPGNDMEYILSIPFSARSSCSMGVINNCSTSRGDAPGYITSIWMRSRLTLGKASRWIKCIDTTRPSAKIKMVIKLMTRWRSTKKRMMALMVLPVLFNATNSQFRVSYSFVYFVGRVHFVPTRVDFNVGKKI